MTELSEQTYHVITKVEELTKTKISYSVTGFTPAAVKHPVAMELAKNAISSSLGSDHVVAECVSPGAEDFHFYSVKTPTIASTMIGLGCDLSPGLHHPKMQFNKEALISGTKILTELLLAADQKDWPVGK